MQHQLIALCFEQRQTHDNETFKFYSINVSAAADEVEKVDKTVFE